MAIKLFDSELKVMDILCKEGDTTAKKIADILKESTGWNINTTYTVIKKCIAKGVVERREPHFLCHALIDRATIQAAETDELLDKLFDGAPEQLFASLVGKRTLSKKQIKALRQMVDGLEE